MKKFHQVAFLALSLLLLTSCAGLSERANDALAELDVSTKGVAEALKDAQRVGFAIEMADLDQSGRLDQPEEFYLLLSQLVAVVSMQGEPEAAPEGE